MMKMAAQADEPATMKRLRPKRSMKGPKARLLASATTGKAASTHPAWKAESPTVRWMKGKSGIIIATLKLIRKKAVQSTATTSTRISRRIGRPSVPNGN